MAAGLENHGESRRAVAVVELPLLPLRRLSQSVRFYHLVFRLYTFLSLPPHHTVFFQRVSVHFSTTKDVATHLSALCPKLLSSADAHLSRVAG